jgi:hypothetical protein
MLKWARFRLTKTIVIAIFRDALISLFQRVAGLMGG